MKNNIKLFVGIVLGILISGVTVYATNYLASDVTYKDTTVDKVLDELYKNQSNDYCVVGSFTGNKCSTTDGQILPINFVPSKFFIYSHNSKVAYIIEYDKNVIGENIYYTWASAGQNKFNFADHFKVIDNSLSMHSFLSDCENNTYYYIACK